MMPTRPQQIKVNPLASTQRELLQQRARAYSSKPCLAVFGETQAHELLSRNNLTSVKYSLTDKPAKTRSRPLLNFESSFERRHRLSLSRRRNQSSKGVGHGGSVVKISMFRQEELRSIEKMKGKRPGREPIHNRSSKKAQAAAPVEVQQIATPVLSISKVQPKEKTTTKAHCEQLPPGVQFRQKASKRLSHQSTHANPIQKGENSESSHRKTFAFLKRGENMRHFMAACFLKDYQLNEQIHSRTLEPSIKEKNKLHRLLGLFTGPVHGIKVGLDLLQEPSPMVDQSRVETEHQRGTSSYSRSSRNRRTESGYPAATYVDTKKLSGWMTSDQA